MVDFCLVGLCNSYCDLQATSFYLPSGVFYICKLNLTVFAVLEVLRVGVVWFEPDLPLRGRYRLCTRIDFLPFSSSILFSKRYSLVVFRPCSSAMFSIELVLVRALLVVKSSTVLYEDFMDNLRRRGLGTK